jgi:hypothetical protein
VAILGTRGAPSREQAGSVCRRIEVGCADDLKSWRCDERLINKDDGASRANGIGNLWTSVGSGGVANGRSTGGQHDEAVDAGGEVDIAGICAEGYARDEWIYACEPLAGGHEIDIDGTGACCLIEKAESDLTRGRGLALVCEGELLQVSGGITEQNRVLGGWSEGAFTCGDDLPATGGVGMDGVGARGKRDVGGDRAESEVEGQGVGALVDVEARGVRSRVDDADLRFGSGADDGLAAGEDEQRPENGESSGATVGMEEVGEHGRLSSAGEEHVEMKPTLPQL